MTEREEHDFLKDYLTWMKGPGLDQVIGSPDIQPKYIRIIRYKPYN